VLRGQAMHVADSAPGTITPPDTHAVAALSEVAPPVPPLRDRQHAEALSSDIRESGGAAVGSPTAPMPATAESAMSLKQFIAEIKMLGIDSRQAMERLGVRSLNGVNLSEALEQLRRQLLGDRRRGSAVAPAHSASSQRDAGRADSSAAAARQGAAGDLAAGRPRPMEVAPRSLRESAMRMSPMERLRSSSAQVADDAGQRAAAALDSAAQHPGTRGASAASGPMGGRYFDEEELPGSPPGEARPLHSVSDERTSGGSEPVLTSIEIAQARNQLNRLREIHGGAVAPSARQLQAFANVVVSQLQPGLTRLLLQKIWRVAVPEKLTADQIQALIDWGKQDDFEEEVQRLLVVAES